MNRKKIIYAGSLIVILTVMFSVGFFVLEKQKNEQPIVREELVQIERPTLNLKPIKIPPPVSMDRLRKQGCVADGLLSEYNPDSKEYIDLINRSNCYYLHRAIETWLSPPDFSQIRYIMDHITKKDVVYGMFIAEAINVRAHYIDNITGEEFDFKKMCRKGSENDWGEGTCKPNFASKEYRKYLEYITRQAIDEGVQSFTFGQIYMQEGSKRKYAPRIIEKMRSYAKERGINVVIGAQTGAINDPEYIKLFDYIEGGVGIDVNGNVEDGPCLASRGSCWALLWHPDFSTYANNILLHLDWTGIPSDDLDIFARMTPEKRAATLRNLYKKFDSQKMGFMMPFFGVLDNENGGCRGPKKKFYSPDNAYTCKDENVINKILKGV